MSTPIKLRPLLAITFITASFVAHNSAQGDEFDDAFAEDVFETIEPIETPKHNESNASWRHEIGTRLIANVNSEKTNAVETRFSGVTSLLSFYNSEVSYTPNSWLELAADITLQTDSIFWLRQNEDWNSQDEEEREFNVTAHALTARVQQGVWQYNTGIQTLTFGLADALSVANTLYAQDLSLPGVLDPKQVAIPAWTSWASGSLGANRLKAGIIHEHKVSKLGAPGTDFTTPLSTVNFSAEPLAFENMSAFLSLSGVKGPLDWQFNSNSQLQHSPTVKMQFIEGDFYPERLEFARTQAASASASYVTGALLFKAEAGFTAGLKAQTLNEGVPSSLTSYNQISTLIGVDYNNNVLGRLMAEAQFGRVLEYDDDNYMSLDKHSAAWLIIYSKDWLRETLTVQAQVMGFGSIDDAGRIQAVSIDYQFSDDLNGSLRFVDYVAGDFPLLVNADDRDRIVVSLAFQF